MENKCSSLGISQRNTNISLGNKNILLCDHLRPSLVSRVSATQQKKIEVHRNEWSQASIVYQVTKVIPELTNQGSDARAAAPQLAALQEAASEWQFPAERQRCCLIMFCPRSSTLIPQGRRKCTVSNFCRTLHGEKSYSRTPRPSLHVNSCWAAVPMDGFGTNTDKAPRPLTLVKELCVPFNTLKGEEKFALFSQLYDSL